MYKKPTAAEIRKRDAFITNLMGQMTLEEKIGQLNLEGSKVPLSNYMAEIIRNNGVGALLGDLFDNRFACSPRELHEIQEYAVGHSRHKIPLMFAYDAIHGHQTVFPPPLTSSCAWDLRHTKTIARLTAREAAANGINWVFSPMVEVATNPHWGRVAETSGCDAMQGARIAETMVRGLQGENYFIDTDHVMATVKHLIGGSAADDDYGGADISEHRFLSFFYPPFRAAAKAGVGSVMTSFSAVNAIPSHANAKLVQRFRRDGFNGFVVADYGAIEQMIAHGIGDENGQRDENPLLTMAVRALKSGVDMDMGSGAYKLLGQAVVQNKVTVQEVDRACRRVLEAKYRLGLFEDPYRFFNVGRARKNRLAPEYRAATREIAGDSCVLLKNDGILPLPKENIKIAVIGPLADDKINILGCWSFGGDSSVAVSVLEGIRNAAGQKTEITHARGANIIDDQKIVDFLNFTAFKAPSMVKIVNDPRSPEDMIAEAVAVAQQADVIIAIIGEAAEMSGESACSVTLEIPSSQRKLLETLVKTGKPVAGVVMNGRPMVLTWKDMHLNAILLTGHGGTEAGNAIADVIFGDRNPSGCLTMPLPKHAGQRPSHHYDLTSGRPNWDAAPVRYSNNAFFNMPEVRPGRGFADSPRKGLYPYGYGLSYTNFKYGPISTNKRELSNDDVLKLSVTVSNTGQRRGKHVVQMYIYDPVASISRPMNELKGFEKIDLAPQESAVIEFCITPDDLKFHREKGGFDWEGGNFVIGIGRDSENLQTVTVNWAKDITPPKLRRKSRTRNLFLD